MLRSLAFLAFSSLLLAAAPRTGRAQNGWTGGGPDGGWVISLLAPYGPQGVLLAGTYGGGVFRSIDGGETWSSISSNASDAVVWDLEFADDANPTVYAATDDRGVLRQTLGLTTWGSASSGLNDPSPAIVSAIDVNPADPARLAAATGRGIYHSNDRGGLWPDSLSWAVGNPFSDVEVPQRDPAFTYGLSYFSLFVSPDRGETVDEWFQNLPLNAYLLDLALWPGERDSMVVADFRGEVWQVRGETFVPIGPAVPMGEVAPRFYRARVLGGETPVIWASSDHGLHRSEDVGASWDRTVGGIGLERPEIWAMLEDDPGAESFWLGSFRFGVLRTGAMGQDWVVKSRGLRASWVRALYARGGLVLAGTAHGRVHASTDDGESWVDVTGDLDALQILAVHRVRGSERWLAASTDGVFRSDDGGTHWLPVSVGSARPTGYRFLQTASMGDDEILLGSIDGALVSRDGGLTFDAFEGMDGRRDPVFEMAMAADSTLVIASGHFSQSTERAFYVGRWGSTEFERLELPPALATRVRGLVFLGDRSDRLVVAAVREPGLAPVGRFEHFTDPGARTFVPLDAGLDVTVGEVTHLVGDAAGRLYLSFLGEGVHESTDGGDTWKDLRAGLASPRVEELALRRGVAPRLYAATFARGVFGRDLDPIVPVVLSGPWLETEALGLRARFEVGIPSRAEVWRRFDHEPAATLWWSGHVEGAAELFDDDPALFAASSRRVEYEWRIFDGDREATRARVSMALPLPASPRLTRLLPGRPNPFNPRTTLVLELAEGETVELEVFDARGRRVRRLFAGEAPAGRHEYVWDGRDERGGELSSGVYLVRARVGSKVHAQRVALVR